MRAIGKIRLLIVLTGVLIAGVIGFTQSFYFELSEVADQKTKTEQHDPASPGEETVISLPSSYSLPASTHISPEQEFSFIEEFLFQGEEAKVTPVAVLITTGRLFKALFHFIISPNAP